MEIRPLILTYSLSMYSNELQIGAIKYQTGQNRAFNGIIDNIRIYDRILEEYEIEFNYDIERPK